jgi:hypothetical protein
MYNDLEQFKDWWLATRPFSPPEENVLSHVADTHGIVLFRHGPYQVELFNVKPFSEIPAHIHPNVDSYEVFVGGDIEFMCNDVWYPGGTFDGSSVRVKPSSYHGGRFGKRGGCFLSIQKWLNGVEPKFVGDDWDDKEHRGSYKESRDIRIK